MLQVDTTTRSDGVSSSAWFDRLIWIDLACLAGEIHARSKLKLYFGLSRNLPKFAENEIKLEIMSK